jgi:sugar lactone lactonase YvrE
VGSLDGCLVCASIPADETEGGLGQALVRSVATPFSGEVLGRIEVDRPCYACTLGGEDGRTPFMVVAQGFGPDRMDELIKAKTGQILAARVTVPHAGWP